tara:strand:+ start:261 stop:428 length:168 start_codon:yes stop_codon:yes gene_type:complete
MATYNQHVTYRKDGVESTRVIVAANPATAQRKLREEIGDYEHIKTLTTVPSVTSI